MGEEKRTLVACHGACGVQADVLTGVNVALLLQEVAEAGDLVCQPELVSSVGMHDEEVEESRARRVPGLWGVLMMIFGTPA
mmetsp:Transcript_116585/g.336764  ORF Transcript_116585/g.336764 Transcript_116585/m.336764 type:complete len:81 (-) Transcript_116585:330-572(-)